MRSPSMHFLDPDCSSASELMRQAEVPEVVTGQVPGLDLLMQDTYPAH